MSGPVLDFDPRAAVPRPGGAPADTRDAQGIFDLTGEQYRVAEDDLRSVQQERLREKYQPVLDALLERGVARQDLYSQPLNPNTAPGVLGDFNRSYVWRSIQRERERARQTGQADPFPSLPQNQQEFEKPELTRFGERYVDQAEIARAPGGTQFASGLLGIGGLELTRPVNVVTLPLGGIGKTALTRILSNGVIQSGIAVAGLPEIAAGREALGEEFTLAEGALYVGGGFVGGAAFQGLGEGLRVVIPPLFERAVAANWDRLPESLKQRWSARNTIVDEAGVERLISDLYPAIVPEHLRSPEELAALTELRRLGEVEAANPYVRTFEGIDTHVGKMEAALRALEEGRVADAGELAGTARPAPVAPVPAAPAPRPAGGGFDLETVKAAIRGPESGGNDNAKNALGSSATGRYQFIEETFVGVYRREFGVSEAAARRAWATSRNNVDVQERLMDRLTLDNAAALQRAGLPTDAGNLYLAHFAGAPKAVELLRAPKDAPVSAFFSAKAIRQNPTYLGGNKTVGDAIDIIRGKVGHPREVSPAPIDPRLYEPELRDPRLDAERPVVALGGQPIATSTFKASEIGVDAELMQFKSGGDQFGVTDRLRTVEEWDSYQAGFVTVWEGLDGRRLIADGHQRLGLATRIGQRTGQDIELNAYVLREADGITAADARRITALRNVAEGSGTKIDAAKVFRDLAPEEVEAVLRRMAKGGEFIRDARGLARLEGQAFGSIINEVIPENYGASIGQLVDDPALHMGMVKILADTQPANRRQAEAIIRQALDAGFVKETQDSLFGPEELMTGLFAQRAKLLDRALSEMKRLKGAFGVAVRNADTLEAGGNKIDVAGSAAEVDANARALALVNALALRKGNAVNELLTRAAERIAAGEPPAAVLKQFVADVRKLDLDAILRETGDVGGRSGGDDGGRGAGDGGDARPFDDADEFGGPGLFGRDEPSPADLDAAAAARPRSDHTDLPPGPDPRFEEPDGPGIVAAAESAWHDVRTAGDDLFAGRLPDETFDLGDGRGLRSVADIRGELDADKAAIDTLRSCMT